MERKLWGQSLEKVQTVLWTPKGRGCTLNGVQIVLEPRYAVAFSFVCWQWQQLRLRTAGPVPSLREVCFPAGADIPVSQWWEKVKRQRKQVCLWHSWPLLKLGDLHDLVHTEPPLKGKGGEPGQLAQHRFWPWLVQLPKYYTGARNRVALICGHQAWLWLHIHPIPSLALVESFLSGACYSLPLLRHGLLLLWIPKLTRWMYWDYGLPSQELYGLAKAPKVESSHSLLLFPCRGDCGNVVLWYRMPWGTL